MRIGSRVALAALVCLLLLPRTAGAAVQWEPVGLGGGGAMFTPAISPVDGKLMMVNCDMSGAYISADGGASWQMIHLQTASIQHGLPPGVPSDGARDRLRRQRLGRRAGRQP